MSRNYPENRTYFSEVEDEMLRSYATANIPVAEQAELLDRPVGSIKTRRRILGLSKVRPEVAAADEHPVVINPVVDDLIGRIALYSFAGALALAAVYAIAGGW